MTTEARARELLAETPQTRQPKLTESVGMVEEGRAIAAIAKALTRPPTQAEVEVAAAAILDLCAECREQQRQITTDEIARAVLSSRALQSPPISGGWNEAIEAAAKVALSFETKDWASYDPRTIATAIRNIPPPPGSAQVER